MRSKLGNTTIVVLVLAVLGALVYVAAVYKYDYLGYINRGEMAARASGALVDLRGSFVSLKQDELAIKQSANKAQAVSNIESPLNVQRQQLSKYIKLTDYNEELKSLAPRLMVTFEALATLELEQAESGGAGGPGDTNLSSFLSLMELLGESEASIRRLT